MVFMKNGKGGSLHELSIPKTSSKTDLCLCPESLESEVSVFKTVSTLLPVKRKEKQTKNTRKQTDSSRSRYWIAACVKSNGSLSTPWKYIAAAFRWMLILVLAVLLLSTIQDKKRATANGVEQNTWQLALFQLLPARFLSRLNGFLNSLELPLWLRVPVLELYSWKFSCNMSEAEVEDLSEYASLGELFTRTLKQGMREVSKDQLMSPTDGKVLYFGRVENGRMEQVKGITYELYNFLGPEVSQLPYSKQTNSSSYWEVCTNETCELCRKQKDLYHIIVYLAPGDYHHFHSPANWTVKRRRHFPGDLLSVAPWAARTMPGLFSLNERVVLSGSWEHGYFSMTPVGAYNVGSIKLEHDKSLETNLEEEFEFGEYRDKELGVNSEGIRLSKGERVGHFELGSSVVLIFEAPENFQFTVTPGQRVKYGSRLGIFL